MKCESCKLVYDVIVVSGVRGVSNKVNEKEDNKYCPRCGKDR